MIEGYDIVCFAPSDWWGMNPSCTTHIMSELAKHNRVLYINPFSSDLLGGIGSRHRRGLAARIGRKFRSLTRGVQRPAENLYVISPVFLPFQGSPLADAFNNVLIRMQIKRACKRFGFDTPLLWLENVRAADAIGWFNPKLIVYHVSDLFTQDKYTVNQGKLQTREARISSASDLLICVSQKLYDLKRSERDNVHYIPHGVDFDLFREAAEDTAPLPELADIPKPIAGYFGTMTANNDIEMMTYCARHLPHVSFVFAGQITAGDYSELGSLDNVHLLGKLPYEKIPHLCASFDVCMLSWKMNSWIRHCNPLKFFEYMASGQPIVSIPIAEIEENYSDLVSIAETNEAFCKAICHELEHDTPDRADRRVAVANEHSWTKHAEKLSKIIDETIAGHKNEAAQMSLVPER